MKKQRANEMRKEELQIGQIIKLGHDTFRVVNTHRTDVGFNAQRLIKSRNTFSKQPHFLQFECLDHCEIVE